MSYGFKFLNNNNQLVIDDRNVKPWLITGPYIGANWKNNKIDLNADFVFDVPGYFRFNAFEDYFPRRFGIEETWSLYEIFYVAPNSINCFAVFTLPDIGQGIWYTSGNRASVQIVGQQTFDSIPLADGAYYPSVSIIVAIPNSWLQTATQEQLAACIPKAYFYAADPIPANSKGLGYGVQVFKENSECVFDSEKKHIRPSSYSFGYVQTPPFPENFMSGGNGDTIIPNPISGFTGSGDKLAFALTTCTYVKMQNPPAGSAAQPSMVQGYFSNIFYNRTGNTLYTCNVVVGDHIWDKETYETNLTPGSVHVIGTESFGALDAAQPSSPVYYSRVLALDTTGFDSPYTPVQFPGSYVLTALSNFDNIAGGEPITSVFERIYPVVNTANPNTMIRFKLTGFNITDGNVPYTISGINTSDIAYIYRNAALQPNSLTGNFIVSGGVGSIDVFLSEDYVTEGTETLTFSLDGGKGSVSVSIKEQKQYSNPRILEAGLSDSIPAIQEDATYTIEITTSNVAIGTTIPYRLNTLSGQFNTSDISSGSLSGNLTVINAGANTGLARGTFTVTKDNITEPTQESFSVSVLYPGDINYTVIIPQVLIQDTSRTPIPTYSLKYIKPDGTRMTGGYTSVNEGTTLNFEIVTTLVPDGTRVYPSFGGLYTSAQPEDLVTPNSWYNPDVTPSFLGVVIYNNYAQFSATIKNDLKTEGIEVFVPFVSRVSNPVLGDGNALTNWFDGWITINDTSVGNETYYAATTNYWVREGQGFQIEFGTSAVTGTTMVWVLSGVDMDDVESMYYVSQTGVQQPFAKTPAASFVFDSTKIKNLAVIMRNDAAVEGAEYARIDLHIVSYDGPLKAYTEIVIFDTSGPTYQIWNDYDYGDAVAEGTTLRYEVRANVPNGDYLYWTNIGTTTADDFNDAYGNTNYGSVLMMNNQGWFERTLKNDMLSDGTETVKMRIDLGWNGGPSVAVSGDVTVADTSLEPTATITPSITSVNEGQFVRFYVSTTNVPDGTYLYWTNHGTASAADFTDNNNFSSVLILDNQGEFDRTIKSDLLTEGTESIIMHILSGGNSTDGVKLAECIPVYINDTSNAYNEQASVVPTTVTYPSGTYFSITNGKPNDTVQWSLDESYDQVFYLDANGSATNAAAGAGFAPATYTIYLYFQGTGHYRQTTWTVLEVNEQVSISPSTVIYPNGPYLSITGGRPSDTVQFSVNNQNYDGATPLNASGSFTGITGANLAVGYYTLYMYFQGSGHYRQVSWSVTAANPAAGTLLNYYCSGVNRYANYADGSGGSYAQLYETNSTSCGYVAPAALVVNNFTTDTNDADNIDLWGSPSATYDGFRCKGAGRHEIDMYITRTFTVSRACVITATLKVSSEANYDFGELYLDGVMYARGSGEYNSGALAGNIGAGTHSVKCRYTKDTNSSAGTDDAFIELSFS